MQVNLREITCKIFGWKVIGSLPINEKYIIAVVPHSSYFDLIIAILIRTYSGLKIKFIGKKELFNPITSFLFKFLGGIPVDRTKKSNIVDYVVELFKLGKINILAVAPEGTRKRVDKFKSGFYYIAIKAEVPIILMSMDYKNKTIKISNPYFPTKNKSKDFEYFENFFDGIIGKVEKYSFFKKN